MARIICADDEADIRRLVAFTLRRRGHEVAEADSGDAALDLIREDPPDLAVLDVMMPGLSGVEVAEAMKEHPNTRRVPVMFLSARGQATEIDEGLATGARAYMVKPFNPLELAERVRDLLIPVAA